MVYCTHTNFNRIVSPGGQELDTYHLFLPIWYFFGPGRVTHIQESVILLIQVGSACIFEWGTG